MAAAATAAGLEEEEETEEEKEEAEVGTAGARPEALQQPSMPPPAPPPCPPPHRPTAHCVRHGAGVGAGVEIARRPTAPAGLTQALTPGQHNRGPPLWLLSSLARLWPGGGGRQLKRWQERKGPAPSPPARSP